MRSLAERRHLTKSLIKTVVGVARLVSGFAYLSGVVNREAKMRPYFAWVMALAATMAASFGTVGVSEAFVAGRGPSMAFHAPPASFHRPALRSQMAPLAEWGRNQDRGWRWRSRGFAGAWPVGNVWPYVSSGYGYDPSANGYGYDPSAYSYGYDTFTYGWYDPSHGYGFDPYTHGNGYGPYGYGPSAYGYGESYSHDAPAPAYDSPRPGYFSSGRFAARPRYAAYSYPVAPNAKIIHLTPRQ
jgi:hypothetical protein